MPPVVIHDLFLIRSVGVFSHNLLSELLNGKVFVLLRHLPVSGMLVKDQTRSPLSDSRVPVFT
jgi:hypothetical protein